MDKAEFEKIFLGKLVRNKGQFFDIPISEYLVTAALFEFDPGDVTILAIMSKDYTPENTQWYTLKIDPVDFKAAIRDFDVLD